MIMSFKPQKLLFPGLRSGLRYRQAGHFIADPSQIAALTLGLLRDLVKPLGVPMTIDVFGLTTTDTTDMGIGQRWEMFVDQADVVLAPSQAMRAGLTTPHVLRSRDPVPAACERAAPRCGHAPLLGQLQ